MTEQKEFETELRAVWGPQNLMSSELKFSASPVVLNVLQQKLKLSKSTSPLDNDNDQVWDLPQGSVTKKCKRTKKGEPGAPGLCAKLIIFNFQ